MSTQLSALGIQPIRSFFLPLDRTSRCKDSDSGNPRIPERWHNPASHRAPSNEERWRSPPLFSLFSKKAGGINGCIVVDYCGTDRRMGDWQNYARFRLRRAG